MEDEEREMAELFEELGGEFEELSKVYMLQVAFLNVNPDRVHYKIHHNW